MKKLYTIVMVFISALCLVSLANSCSDESKLIEELDLANVLTPTSTSASISIYDGRTVTFTWASSSTATHYCLEIYRWATGSEPASASEITEEYLDGISAYQTYDVEQGSGSSTTYEVFLEVDYSYYARVKGQNEPYQGDSHWAAFRYPIEPYLIMDPIPTYEMTGRTDKSISLGWTIDEGDTDGINQIRVSPNPDDPDSAYKIYTVSSGATECTVDGLSPLTEYTLSANFGTATRATIVEWTMPSTEGATTVTDSASFVNALITWDYSLGALKLVVDYNNGETYNAGAIPVLGELEITGNGVAANPVIKGYFNIYEAGDFTMTYDEVEYSVTSVGASSLKATNLYMSGGDYSYSNAITNHGSTEKTLNVEVTNCEFDSYTSGIFYDNQKATAYGTVSFNGVYATNTKGTGGDFFDVRSSTISNFSVTNSTFTDGCRTFVRYQGETIGDVNFSNNTINGMADADDGNNKGIFRIVPTEPNSFKLSGNLFLNCNGSEEYTVLAWQGTAAPTLMEKNFFYNNTSTFLYVSESDGGVGGNGHKDISPSAATANGGAQLTDDPCHDSIRGNFYVTDADVISAKAGDPRWYADYIEQPEPALEVVEYGYEWNLTDTKTFYDVIDQTVTRGNTRFLIEDTPIEVNSEGFYFTDKATLMGYSHAPSDCGIGFIVDGPGSVVLSVAEGAQTGFEVAYGVYDEGLVGISGVTTIAGNVAGGARKQSIVLDALTADTIYMVYIYSLGPATLTQLVWSDDTSTGGSGLTAPYDLTLSAEKASSTDDVTLSWAAIPNAATYNVHYVGYNGVDKTDVTDTNSCTINGLEVGYYNIYVQAVPAESDTTRDESDWSDEEVLFFSQGGSLSNVSAYSDTDWGSSTFEYLFNAITGGEGGNFTEDFVYDNLHFTGGNTSSVLNDAVNYAGETVYAYSFGGSGSATSRSMIFNVPGNGTLNMEIESGSGSGDSRWMKVFVDGEEYTTGENYGTSEKTEATGAGYEAPIKGSPRQHKITITGAHSGSEIMIYSASSGIIVLSLGWTPEPVEGEGITPDDETITEEYITDYTNEGTDAGYADVADGETLTVNKITYAGAITWDSSRYKMNGASKVGDDGIPTSRYACFKIATTGKITHKMISGSSGDAERKYDVILVKGGEVTTLYSEYAPTSSGADAVVTEVTAEHLAGATEPVYIYVYVEANCNLYQIGFTPDN